ncbi:MAG: DUF4169 family protein [Rhodospirillales bacterium]
MKTINLNHFRKAKAKADKKSSAAANRVKFGRTKAERVRDSDAESRRQKLLDGAQREES